MRRATALLLAALGACSSGSDADPDVTVASSAPPASTAASAVTAATDSDTPVPPIRVALNGSISGGGASGVVDGHEAYWKTVDDVAGRPVELVVLDDGGDLATHVENTTAIVADPSIVVVGHSSGTEATAATRDQRVAAGLVAITSSRYSGWHDDELGANTLSLGASLCIEAMNGVSFIRSQAGGGNLAIVTEAGDDGADSAAGARLAAALLGLTLVFDGEAALVGGADLGPVVDTLVAAEPDLVWVAADPSNLAQLLGPAHAAGLSAVWSGSAETWSADLLRTPLAEAADAAYVHTSPFAVWSDTDVGEITDTIVDEIAGTADASDTPATDAFLRGWLEATVTHRLLTRAADDDLTRDAVVAAADGFEVDLGALAPAQSWSSGGADDVVRSTYHYDVSLGAYRPGRLGDGPDVNLGYIALDGPYQSGAAESFVFEEPCAG
ncbi:MAG: ABC transporter substrate-binding protein [Ilumatobacter sp.]|uniref:ABC transporter substrate-binding protein n=1 Tax=Ilumatobacter sp. TaxID=1967498 RepID=UPI00262BAFB5|nr:ABC transporter substrate-binding protein [Ilumatobacter sp.]MDJ0768180.1 ABC transporter substrate-binding protein [Ilumatobacter sp.]